MIQRAYQLYRRRRFPQAVRLLESQVFRFRDNAHFYALLGNACLYAGDLGGAESYLRRADQLRPDDVRVLLGLAAIAFRRGQSDEALHTWLHVLDLDPRNRRARHALGALRRSTASDAGQLFQLRDSLKIERFYPPVPPRRRSWVLPLCLAAGVAALVLGYLYLLPQVKPRRAVRPGLAEIELTSSQPALSAQEGEGQLILTDKEIIGAFAQAKQYLLEYRDNLAVREVNRLMASNASAYVKEKARMLKTFAVQPDFSTVKDPFPFEEVRADPALYTDTYVVWRGKVANMRVSATALTFDLLVGYQDERELLGIVPVALEFAVTLEDGTAVEVLGQVRWLDGRLSVRGVSIHRLYGRS